MPMRHFFPNAETTRGITVRVAPRYLPEQSDPQAPRFVWSYHVRIENHGEVEVQLLRRHWLITDAYGRSNEVDGDGVVGEQPLIAPGGAFDYISGCPLPTTSGSMRGHYTMRSEGGLFDVAIPGFMLQRPASAASSGL